MIEFKGALALALDWIDVTAKDFWDFGALKERLAMETNRAKRRKFVAVREIKYLFNIIIFIVTKWKRIWLT